jgi:hypothetical protein
MPLFSQIGIYHLSSLNLPNIPRAVPKNLFDVPKMLAQAAN